MGFKRGLSAIPSHIAEQLSPETLSVITDDAHGISFPDVNLAQMRYVKKGVNLGRSYNIKHFPSWETLILQAVSDCKTLRVTRPNSGARPDPEKGIRFHAQLRPGREYAEYCWIVSFHKLDGTQSQKAFYCGNDNSMSTFRKQHALLTAKHFRRLYCESLDPQVLSSENVKNWQHVCYYNKMKPVNW